MSALKRMQELLGVALGDFPYDLLPGYGPKPEPEPEPHEDTEILEWMVDHSARVNQMMVRDGEQDQIFRAVIEYEGRWSKT